LRPQDAVYQADKGDLLYNKGDLDGANRQWDAADKMAAGQGKRVQANLLASRVERGLSYMEADVSPSRENVALGRFWRDRTCQDARKYAQLTGDTRLLDRTTRSLGCPA
jgi:hypothetical protein